MAIRIREREREAQPNCVDFCETYAGQRCFDKASRCTSHGRKTVEWCYTQCYSGSGYQCTHKTKLKWEDMRQTGGQFGGCGLRLAFETGNGCSLCNNNYCQQYCSSRCSFANDDCLAPFQRGKDNKWGGWGCNMGWYVSLFLTHTHTHTHTHTLTLLLLSLLLRLRPLLF
jgi:hypothetical protein